MIYTHYSMYSNTYIVCKSNVTLHTVLLAYLSFLYVTKRLCKIT